LKAGLIDPVEPKGRFASAEETSRGELKLRVHNSEEARAVLKWIGAE
jgi:hypothetical protein